MVSFINPFFLSSNQLYTFTSYSQFNENDFGNQRLEAICLFCQTQQVKALPVSVRNAVLERETLQDDLISLSHTFSMDAFVSALIASLLDGSDDNVSQLLDLLPCMESCCGKVCIKSITYFTACSTMLSTFCQSSLKSRLKKFLTELSKILFNFLPPPP